MYNILQNHFTLNITTLSVYHTGNLLVLLNIRNQISYFIEVRDSWSSCAFDHCIKILIYNSESALATLGPSCLTSRSLNIFKLKCNLRCDLYYYFFQRVSCTLFMFCSYFYFYSFY